VRSPQLDHRVWRTSLILQEKKKRRRAGWKGELLSEEWPAAPLEEQTTDAEWFLHISLLDVNVEIGKKRTRPRTEGIPCHDRRGQKVMMLALNKEHAFSDMFVAYLLARNIRYQEDL
jgi:hypothetical protein